VHTLITFKALDTQEQLYEEKIRTWLVGEIALLSGLPSDKIDINEPFASYGLDSVASAALSGEVAAWLGIQLPPTVSWDYPSVRLMAQYLAANTVSPLAMAA
jgi:acyl carrier protein